MTGAELAVWRHLLGLTIDDLAAVLGVNERTARAWESGRDPVPARVPDEVAALGAEHSALTRRMVTDGRPVAILRDKTAQTVRPRGWYVAAAARALAMDPSFEVVWS